MAPSGLQHNSLGWYTPAHVLTGPGHAATHLQTRRHGGTIILSRHTEARAVWLAYMQLCSSVEHHGAPVGVSGPCTLVTSRFEGCSACLTDSTLTGFLLATCTAQFLDAVLHNSRAGIG